jgi:hypothetical protein
MKLLVSQGGAPPGSYLARFESVEAVTNDFGDGLKWWFEIVGGPHAGCKTSGITARKPTLKNSCGKLVSGILGTPLSNDMEIDLAAYFGQQFLVVVAQGKTGGTYVSAVTRPPVSATPLPAPPAPPPMSPAPQMSLS